MALRLFYLFIVFLTFINCGKKETIINSYGSSKNESADKHVIVKLNEFKTYSELIERLEKIACQDSVPKIIFHNKNSIENIFPVFDCHPAPFNPRGKYALSIKRDKVYVDDTEIKVTRKLLPHFSKNTFLILTKVIAMVNQTSTLLLYRL